jgi:hypothetical protein
VPTEIRVWERVRTAGEAEAFDPDLPGLDVVQSRTVPYRCDGTDSEALMLAAVKLTLPRTVPSGELLLYLKTYNWTYEGGGLWDVNVLYTAKKPGQIVFTFDTEGGTQHVTEALDEVVWRPDGNKQGALQFHNAIGATQDQVEGADVVVAGFKFTLTKRFLATELPADYIASVLYKGTGKTNKDVFSVEYKGQVLVFNPNELLFMGARNNEGQVGDDEIELTFSFQASENLTDIVLGKPPPKTDNGDAPPAESNAITVASKDGWQYLWVRYQDKQETKMLVKQRYAAVVNTVYRQFNYADFRL